jgi:hypothetical protein
MTLRILKKFLISLVFLLLAIKLSDHLYTLAETQVRGWYLAQPSFTVMGMAEGMSADEQLDQ